MIRPECIFCKSTTASFTSVEHIVPESLGNTEHLLPPGLVCDPCNNYFARKVEQPILGTDWFTQARNRTGIWSKRGRIPEIKALSHPQGIPIDLGVDREARRYISASHDRDNDRFVRVLQRREHFSALFPVAKPPDRWLFARFLAAIGMKATAQRMLPVPDGIHHDFTHNNCFDEVRRFARYGEGPSEWPLHETVLYDEHHVFNDPNGSSYQISHEYTLLWTDSNEFYFVIALFGVQYAINMGGPELEGFHTWLSGNDNHSPLYLPGME